MLLEKLIRKQEEAGESDREFAEMLGVPRSTWQLTRTRRVSLGAKVARGAQRAFPDLTPDVVYFFLTDATIVAESDNDEAGTAE